MEDGVASPTDEEKPRRCHNCTAKDKNNSFQRCSGCHSTIYCSKECQRKDRKGHRKLCEAIQLLQQENEVNNVFVSHLSAYQKDFVDRLVGHKCEVKAKLNDIYEKCLWDTGAQVSLVSKSWLKENIDDVNIRNFEEILDEDPVQIKAANNATVPFAGFVELKLKISDLFDETVPFIVTEIDLESPIIGFNVISQFVKDGTVRGLESKLLVDCLVDVMEVKAENAEKLVSMLKDDGLGEQLCVVKVSKRKEIIPAGTTVNVKCRVNTGPIHRLTPVMFEPLCDMNGVDSHLQINETLLTVKKGKASFISIPIHNHSKHDVILNGRTIIGNLQMIKSVTPIPVKFKPLSEKNDLNPEKLNKNNDSNGKSLNENNDLNHDLNSDKKVVGVCAQTNVITAAAAEGNKIASNSETIKIASNSENDNEIEVVSV